MLISIASIGESSNRRVTSAYSSIVEPQTFAMKRVSLKSSVGRILLDDVFDAGVLEADRIQHAGRRFPDAVRRVAEPRRERGALQHDGADGGVAEALDARVFLAEADAAGQQHDRRVELQTAKVELEAAHRSRAALDIGALSASLGECQGPSAQARGPRECLGRSARRLHRGRVDGSMPAFVRGRRARPEHSINPLLWCGGDCRPAAR